MKRVLVVDDEPHIVRLVSYTLSAHGFEVIEAADGSSAIEIAAAEQPDLILMDVGMPVIDGYQACERLKADPLTASIPVVMLSAKSQAVERATGLQSGATRYITKPFVPKDLVRQVVEVIGR